MKVVHVCRIGWPALGGMETAVHQLALAQSACGIDVQVVTLDHSVVDGQPLEEGVYEGIVYRRIRGGFSRYPFAVGLKQMVRGADLIHAHGLDGLTDTLLLDRPAPVVVSTHGGFFHSSEAWWKKALAASWTTTLLRRADAVLFTSQSDAARFPKVIGQVIPNPVDIDRFLGPRTPEPGRWVVFGRIDRHKGFESLFDTLSRLMEIDSRDFCLEAIGAGPTSAINAMIRRCLLSPLASRVRWRIGMAASEVKRVLLSCEAAFFPSQSEGFGMALAEVMGAGIPPIANPIPAFRERIRPGVNGWLLDFSDRRAADWIVKWRNRTSELDDLAIRSAVVELQPERVVERVVKVYSDILGKKS